MQDGHLVETVIIRHEHITTSNVRYTVCVSSQVECEVWFGGNHYYMQTAISPPPLKKN